MCTGLRFEGRRTEDGRAQGEWFYGAGVRLQTKHGRELDVPVEWSGSNFRPA